MSISVACQEVCAMQQLVMVIADAFHSLQGSIELACDHPRILLFD